MKVKNKSDDLKANLKHYRNIVQYLGCNVPIQVLCLPKRIEKCLLDDGIIRVYDLIGMNLAEIKGIGEVSVGLLASRLDEFFTVSI